MSRKRRLLVALAVGVGVLVWWFWRTPGRSYREIERTYDGGSDGLKQTKIVPTLDTPIPEGMSAIWCSSFQFAWNELKTVAKGPVRLQSAEELSEKLNRAGESVADLATEDCYAAAGLVRDGIVRKIQDEMVRRFPDVPRPNLSDAPAGGAVAYAYLQASAKFTLPFFDNDSPFLFTDSSGKQTAITSFGIREEDEYAYHRLREQVDILHVVPPSDRIGKEIPEFVLDPCKHSQPYQIVFARIPRKDSLAEMLQYANSKVEQVLPEEQPGYGFGVRYHLLVPNMHWRVEHHFKELEGPDKRFLQGPFANLYMDQAMQTIQFKVDRSGAELASESKHYVKPWSWHFLLNQPFLIYMKKRDATHPFFVMWVDNAELLCKR